MRSTDAWREVIGVVQSVHQDGLYEEAPSLVYWPVRVERMFGAPVAGTPAVAFVIRSERAGTASLMNEVRQAVQVGEREYPDYLESARCRTFTPARSRARRSRS